MKKFILLLFIIPYFSFSQEDLLAGMDSVVVNEKVESAFKAMKIINLESTKLAAKGDLYFIVAHRFASVKTGFEGFVGLDAANVQIKFIYGLKDWLSVGAARSEQAYDFTAKYRLQHQIKDGFPVSIVGFSSLAFNNLLKESDYPKLKFDNRIIYVNQLLISRKFSDKLSLEFVPTVFHENFNPNDLQDNTQFALGFGGRYKLTKRLSLNMDYAAHLNRASNSLYKNPLSVGLDIETGGHVFQLHFSSSQGIHEAGYLGQTTGDWTKGDVYFGFNLARVF